MRKVEQHNRRRGRRGDRRASSSTAAPSHRAVEHDDAQVGRQRVAACWWCCCVVMPPWMCAAHATFYWRDGVEMWLAESSQSAFVASSRRWAGRQHARSQRATATPPPNSRSSAATAAPTMPAPTMATSTTSCAPDAVLYAARGACSDRDPRLASDLSIFHAELQLSDDAVLYVAFVAYCQCICL